MSVVSKEKLLKKLSKKAYRDAYAEESVKTSLPFQIKAMREQRDWSQAILGRKSNMKQNAVSRLESAEYGNLSVNTLLRLANCFDCALLVKFVPFSRLVREFEDVSPSALEVGGFEDDLVQLQSWADNAQLDSLNDFYIDIGENSATNIFYDSNLTSDIGNFGEPQSIQGRILITDNTNRMVS